MHVQGERKGKGSWYLDGCIAESVEAKLFHASGKTEGVGGDGALLFEEGAVLVFGVDAGLLHLSEILEGEILALQYQSLVLRIRDRFLEEEANVVPGKRHPRGDPALEHHQSRGLEHARRFIEFLVDDVYAQYVGATRIRPLLPAGDGAILPGMAV